MPEALFYGSGTALVTPFAGDQVDYGAWHRLIEGQLARGVDALVVLGSTGEAATVTFQERVKLISVAVSLAAGRVPVIVSAASNSTRTAMELAQNARELGADGILLSAPWYNRPKPEGIRAHFFQVADAGGLPVIAYNIPSRTCVNISPALMGELARHPLIRGLKEASSDAAHISEMLAQVGEGVAVYAGNDMNILPIMAQGGRGAITVAGNLVPEAMTALTHAMLRDDLESARRVMGRIAPLLQALGAEVNPGPIKQAMSMRGLCEAGMRLPMTPVSENTCRLLEQALTAAGA